MAAKYRPHRTSLLHTAAGLTGILMLGACAHVMAHSINSEMKRSAATLIGEMQRSSGDPQ